MKAFVVLSVIVGAALAAPTQDIDTQDESLREKKSTYGLPGVPCAGAGPAPLALYLAPGPQLQQGLPHYRNEEEETEARSPYYEGPAAAAAAAAAGAASAANAANAASAPLSLIPAGGPIGTSAVFPSAKVGGCAVPLLLSCAPNVFSGHLASSGYAAPAYRSQEDEHDQPMKANEWMDTERTSGFVHQHHGPGLHHGIGQGLHQHSLLEAQAANLHHAIADLPVIGHSHHHHSHF